MRRFHVCNGDADGLCAVQQWRLHDPAPATVVTGLKRDIPQHDKLELRLDTDPQVCTSLLKDRFLGGRFHAWALVDASGGALTATAHQRAAAAGFGADQRDALRRLGEAINYKAYGDTLHDVRLWPAASLRRMAPYADPLEMAAVEPIVDKLDGLPTASLERFLAALGAFHWGSEVSAAGTPLGARPAPTPPGHRG